MTPAEMPGFFIFKFYLFKVHQVVQWESKYRTSPVSEWSILVGTGLMKTRPFKKPDKSCRTGHLNTGPLEFRTQTGHSKFVCKKFHLNIRLHFVRFLNWSGDSNVRYSIVWYLDIHCTVGIQKLGQSKFQLP